MMDCVQLASRQAEDSQLFDFHQIFDLVRIRASIMAEHGSAVLPFNRAEMDARETSCPSVSVWRRKEGVR